MSRQLNERNHRFKMLYISGVLLVTAIHKYKKGSFDLMVGEINIKEGVWIGAQTTVRPSITCYSLSISTVSSIITKNITTETTSRTAWKNFIL